MRCYVIALTGGMGSGKSTIAQIFSLFGVPIIDSDLIVGNIYRKNVPILSFFERRFGKDIFSFDGSLRKDSLRKYIFNDLKEKNIVEQLIHPKIYEYFLEKIKTIRFPYMIWVVPLLIEKNLQRYVDRVLVIDVPISVQIERIRCRDKIDQETISKILSCQASRFHRLNYANDILKNVFPKSTMKDKIFSLHKKYYNLFKNRT